MFIRQFTRSCTVLLMLGFFFTFLPIHIQAQPVRTPRIFEPVSPHAADSLTFRDENGKLLTLEQMRGKPVILHYWSTWCKICQPELKELDQFIANGSLGIEVVALADNGDLAEKIAQHFVDNGLAHIKVYRLNFNQGWHKGYPASYLINAKGEIVAEAEHKVDWLSPETALQIQTLLGR